MTEGWLLYHREDYDRNRWFAGELIRHGKTFGLNLLLRIAGEPEWDEGAPPAFAVNRTRDWRVAFMLERQGCRVFNPSVTARAGNDKIASNELAERLGLPQTPWEARENRPECVAAHALGYPVVFKNPYGHGGNEVFIAKDERELLVLASALPCSRVLLEKPCGRPGVDVRVYMLGGCVLAAVRRSSSGVDFRANLSLGGTAEYYELNAIEREMAGRVASALPLDWAGVDFLQDEAGHLLFNEIEDAVGARSLYQLGGHDAAQLFMKHIRKELDRSGIR